MSLPKKLSALILILLAFGLWSPKASAQNKPKITGSITGQIRDSADLGILPQATIAIYRTRDTSLVKYQLGDERGRFTTAGLPIDTSLTLIVTYVGYKPATKEFKLTMMARELTLPRILLAVSNNTLAEVKVKVPPIEMRGDTLIFNTDAFKARKNAVIGDLIRELPGFVMWGDGKMEVAGRPVSEVTVDGKTFFASDPRIALNNLPKTAVSQVQVINDNDVNTATGDTIKKAKVNLVLKKSAKTGAFGKIGYGRGTRDREEGDASVNFYTPKDQASVVASTNNVNRNTLTAQTMIAFSSYSSGLTQNMLFSNFDRSGITDQKALGFTHNRTWDKRFSSYSSYNINQSTQTITRSTNSNTFFKDSSIIRDSYSQNINSNNSNTFRSTMNFRDSSFNRVSLTVNASNSRGESTSMDTLGSYSTNRFLNRSMGSNNRSSNANNQSLSLTFDHSYDGKKHDYRPSKEDFNLTYELSRNRSESDNTRINSLTDLTGTNTGINRRFDQEGTSYNHAFNITYSSFGNLFKLRQGRHYLTFQSEVRYNTDDSRSTVNDFSGTTNGYTIRNQYLSNTNQLGLFTYRPSVYYSRTITKTVAGRFIQSLAFKTYVKGQFISQDNASDKDFRNINRKYNSFIPEASLTYTDRITGARNWEIKAGYKTSSDIPYVDQLARFIDSTSLYYFALGNRNLRSNYQHNFELSASWQQENTYPASLKLAVNAVSIENYISDSSYYDNRGVNINTPVNVNGYRDYGADMRFTKAFVINKKQITYALNSRISSRSVPLFANNLPVTSEQKSLTANSELGYTYSTYLGVYLLSSLDIRQSKFGSDARTNQNMIISNGLEFIADLPKGIRLNSSARMTHNRATNLPGTDIVIWNAQMSYRMGKKMNYEVKFTANDILNKTQGIYTSSNANTLVVRRTNALQQYFLVGLAYYPRFFGGNN